MDNVPENHAVIILENTVNNRIKELQQLHDTTGSANVKRECNIRYDELMKLANIFQLRLDAAAEMLGHEWWQEE